MQMCILEDVSEKSKSKRQNPDYTKLTADIPKDIANKVRALAALSEMSLSESVTEALQDWVQKKKENHKYDI